MPMPTSKGILLIWKDYSFVIIRRKGDLVHLPCENLMLLIVNDVIVRSCAFSHLSDSPNLCMRSQGMWFFIVKRRDS